VASVLLVAHPIMIVETRPRCWRHSLRRGRGLRPSHKPTPTKAVPDLLVKLHLRRAKPASDPLVVPVAKTCLVRSDLGRTRRLGVVGIVLPTLAIVVGCSGRSNVGIGGPCALDESCITGVCIRETRQAERRLWPGGYCSGNCANGQPCPSASCQRFEDGRSYCVSLCGEEGDCRAGYVCSTAIWACLPDCRSGWFCGSTLVCNEKTGTCDPPPVTPGPIGAPCTWNAECASSLCTPEQGASGPTYWTGGSCTLDCGKASCPSGSTCVTFASGGAFCSTSCVTTDDCRSNYVCSTAAGACLPDCRLGWPCGSTLVCNEKSGTCDPPPVTPGPIGAPCTWNAECASSLCTPEQGASGPTYWTGGSCTQDCARVGCPSGSTCVPLEPSGAYCVASCSAAGGCRPGYVCALDIAGCLPDCNLGWSCGTSLVCDANTGLCVPPSAYAPDAGADAGAPHDVRPTNDSAERSDAMGGDGRGGGGGPGPGPGGPT
jgi:hypothetical protein